MAYGNGRSSFWRKKRSSEVVEKRGIESQRPMLMEEVSTKMAQSNRQTEQEGEVEETTQQKENIRVITGFVDDEKLELLSRSRFLVETDCFYHIEEIVDFQVEGNVFRVRVMEVDGLLGLTGEEESGED
ncbi:hypothetical protein V6N13_068434 [Hibiscus sabdariffa]